jgi:hypothetical protein
VEFVQERNRTLRHPLLPANRRGTERMFQVIHTLLAHGTNVHTRIAGLSSLHQRHQGDDEICVTAGSRRQPGFVGGFYHGAAPETWCGLSHPFSLPGRCVNDHGSGRVRPGLWLAVAG